MGKVTTVGIDHSVARKGSRANVSRACSFDDGHSVTSNDRVERPATMPLAACRASQQLVGNQGAGHDSPRSAPTRG